MHVSGENLTNINFEVLEKAIIKCETQCPDIRFVAHEKQVSTECTAALGAHC